ncbi:MAG: hypothetical protein IPI49_02645 [Myxococcales bacterium]|nr:hypothetical protein [Myxococcales bacterium]
MVNDELEQQRDRTRLRRDLEENQKLRASSEAQLAFSPELLRETLDVALELAGAGNLTPVPAASGARDGAFSLPALPETWQRTLDTIRPRASGKRSCGTGARARPCPWSSPRPTS